MEGILSFFDKICQGFSGAWEWLNDPMWVNWGLGDSDGYWTTPLALFSIGGLTLFVSLAVLKWVIGIVWG